MRNEFVYTRRFVHRVAVGCALFGLLVGLVGCGASGSADQVTGKVTFNGQPVAGEVVFVGLDRKEAASPITDDGTYKIKSPPKGEVQVIVKGQQVSNPAVPRNAKNAPEAG